jgi:peptide/nickel transport system substrate-binding protein
MLNDGMSKNGDQGSSQGMTRRVVLGRGAAGLGALSLGSLLAACGSSGSSTSGGGAALKLLQVSVPDTPPSLDSDGTYSFMGDEVNANTYSDMFAYKYTPEEGGLVSSGKIIGSDLSGIENQFVESYEVSKDFDEVTVVLRDDVVSSAGNKLTADDVVWTYQRRAAIGGTGAFIMGAMNIEGASVKKVDAKTVRFTSIKGAKSPLFFAGSAANHFGGILDTKVVKTHVTPEDEWATEWLNKNTAGFAQYDVTEYLPGQSVRMKTNPNYNSQFPPSIEEVLYTVSTNSGDRLAQLVRGDVDVALYLTPQEYATAEKSDGVSVFSVTRNAHKFLALNNTIKPLDDPRVRQALAYVTPAEQILKDVGFGFGEVMKSGIAPGIPSYTDEFWVYDENVDKARSLLQAAGVGDGFDLEVVYANSAPEDAAVLEILRTAYGQIGVKVSARGLQEAPYNAATLQTGEGELAQASMITRVPYVPDPVYAFQLIWGAGQYFNSSMYENAEITKLIEVGLNEADLDKRLAIGRQMQQIWASEVPGIPIYAPATVFAYRSDLTNLTWNPTNRLEFGSIKSA